MFIRAIISMFLICTLSYHVACVACGGETEVAIQVISHSNIDINGEREVVLSAVELGGGVILFKYNENGDFVSGNWDFGNSVRELHLHPQWGSDVFSWILYYDEIIENPFGLSVKERKA